MQTRFEQHLQHTFPFLKDKKILLAISGGIDSVVLGHLCKNANLDFSLAHCNFQLRGKESDEDAQFVKKWSKKWDVPLFVEVFETQTFAEKNKLSIQMAARKLRYDWFEKLSQTLKFDVVFTAHHANDNLETFLINTLRGTGLEGLTGIPERNGNVLRPLLPFSRAEIEAFAKTAKIDWREDSSNRSDHYLRNKIRHQIVPILQNENPELLKSFAKTQEHLQQTSQLLKEYSKKLSEEISTKVGNELHFDVQKIAAKPNPRAVLYQLLNPFGFTEWENVHSLLSAQAGKVLFSSTHRLIKNRDELILTCKPVSKKRGEAIKISANTDEITFSEGKLKLETTHSFQKSGKNEVFAEKKAIKFPLKLRKWEKGDYFYPFGMEGRKKVSDFLKDEKRSLPEKEKTWVLLSGDKIIWVVGQRADNRFRVKGSTSEVFKITYFSSSGPA